MNSSASQPRFDLRRHLAVAAVVFLIALAFRLLFLLTSVDRAWPHSVNYEGDAIIWAHAADLFARGDVPDEGVPHRFYAIAHLLHWLRSDGAAAGFTAFKVAWCALSALACASGYLVFARNLPSRAAVIASSLCVVSFGSYVLATSLNVEGLYAPILILIVGGTLELARRPDWRLVGALAPLHALALLTREEHLVLLFLLAGYVLWRWRRRREWYGHAKRPVTRPSVPRRLALVGTMTAGAIALCLPYSLHATRATEHYNTVPKRAPNYESQGSGVSWAPDGRDFVESLPAFVRAKTVALVEDRSRQRQVTLVTAQLARSILIEFFGYLPEPLTTPVFIASHGPMSFALSNHPASNGGFSRAALETPQQKDPRLNLTLPEHLRIFNHGYTVGWGFIRADVGGWLGNVAKKLAHGYQGVALGFTAYNLPLGRYGERRACDLLTPLPGSGLAWQCLFGALLLVGGIAASRTPVGGLLLLVIAYKVVILIFYYGYSRQTVSILPVFLAVVALGIDGALDRFGHPAGSWFRTMAGGRFGGWLAPRRAGRAVATGLLALVVGLEIHAATHPPSYRVVGPIRPMPQWGPSSFSANSPVELRPELEQDR